MTLEIENPPTLGYVARKTGRFIAGYNDVFEDLTDPVSGMNLGVTEFGEGDEFAQLKWRRVTDPEEYERLLAAEKVRDQPPEEKKGKPTPKLQPRSAAKPNPASKDKGEVTF